MANHKSAAKRARQNVKRRSLNKSKKSTTRSMIKNLKGAIEGGNKEEAQTLLTKTQSLLSKLSKGSALSKKTGSRITSRLTKSVNKLK